MPWREVRTVDETGSTNADLVELAAAGEPAGLVLVARSQTHGRGRLGRAWVAPAGSGLTFSVLLRPAREPSALGWLPLAAGVAVAEAVRVATGVDAGLKWPNDVVVGDGAVPRKLGGILAERVVAAPGPPAVVLGVGLNVDLGLEVGAGAPRVPGATSLRAESGAVVDADLVLRTVLDALDHRCRAWDGGRDPRADYLALCRTLGLAVRAELPGGGTVEGVADDVDRDGRLVVLTEDGPHAVGAGDVVHLR